MLTIDLDSSKINIELEKTEQINYISALYQVPVWRVKQKIKQGVSLLEMEAGFDLGAEL
jgi:hypothetical protein